MMPAFTRNLLDAHVAGAPEVRGIFLGHHLQPAVGKRPRQRPGHHRLCTCRISPHGQPLCHPLSMSGTPWHAASLHMHIRSGASRAAVAASGSVIVAAVPASCCSTARAVLMAHHSRRWSLGTHRLLTSAQRLSVAAAPSVQTQHHIDGLLLGTTRQPSNVSRTGPASGASLGGCEVKE